MIANLLTNPREKVTLKNLDSYIPHVYYSDEHLKTFPRPRIIKSHEAFNAKYSKIIYITRDPRDVAVSYYFYWIRRNFIDENYSLEKFIEDFLTNKVDKKYGTWKENIGSWIGAKGDSKDFMLIKYERLLENTIGVLSQIVDFLNLRVSQGRIKKTVESSSISEIKYLEEKQPDWEKRVNTNKEIPFFRKGTVGTWKEELPPLLTLEIEKKYWKLMRHLGYDLEYNRLGSPYVQGFIGSLPQKFEK